MGKREPREWSTLHRIDENADILDTASADRIEQRTQTTETRDWKTVPYQNIYYFVQKVLRNEEKLILTGAD